VVELQWIVGRAGSVTLSAEGARLDGFAPHALPLVAVVSLPSWVGASVDLAE